MCVFEKKWIFGNLHFSENRKYFDFIGVFCKGNCNFEYRIRIRCIEVYMVTWFKKTNRHFSVVVVVVDVVVVSIAEYLFYPKI